MKRIALILSITISTFSFGQAIKAWEVGLDGFFGASTLGGSFGLGPKLGLVLNENLVIGPSFRYQRTWSQPVGFTQQFNANNYGGGIFLHARYNNIIYGGFETEVFKNNGFIDTSARFKKIVPTFFICAGFSKEFNEKFRLNVGIYYDIINSLNSPFRSGYVMTIRNAQTGQIQKYIPMIYRISIFVPIKKNKKKEDLEEIEEEMEE
jgi:hypothetical protein